MFLSDDIISEDLWKLHGCYPTNIPSISTGEAKSHILYSKGSRETPHLGKDLADTRKRNQNIVLTSSNGVVKTQQEPTQVIPWARLSFTTRLTVLTRAIAHCLMRVAQDVERYVFLGSVLFHSTRNATTEKSNKLQTHFCLWASMVLGGGNAAGNV